MLLLPLLVATMSLARGSLAADCTAGKAVCNASQMFKAREIACNSHGTGTVDCGNGWKVSAGLQWTVNKDVNQAYNEHCWVRAE